MRELLQQALDALNTCAHNVIEVRGNGRAVYYFDTAKVQAVKEAIEAALSRSKWVKVADGLPVVPEGAGYIFIWAYSTSKTIYRIQYSDLRNACLLHVLYSHWMYCVDDTPAPPEDL